MVCRHIWLVIAAALLTVGCATVERAHKMQERFAPAGKDDAAKIKTEPVDLNGASLRELVQFAITNRPSMRAAALAVEDARLALKEIAADAPVLSETPLNAARLNASISHSAASAPDHLDSLGGSGKGSAAGALSLDLLVWDFGRNNAQARAQVDNVIAAELSLVEQGLSVFEDVSGAYLTLLMNDALLEVALTNEVQYSEHLRQALDRVEQGVAKDLDVLKAELDLARARESVVAASNDVVVAGAKLMAALGIEASDGEFVSVIGARPGGLNREVKCLEPIDIASGDMFAFACTNAPAVRVARAKLRSASAQVDYAVANLMPTVSASVSLNWTDPLWLWRWGVSGVQSIFTGFRKTTAVDRAVVALAAAENNVRIAEQNLSCNIELAVAERDNSREAALAAAASLARAKDNLENVKTQYDVGDVSRIDFTDAEADYSEALGNCVKAFYRGQKAEANLFRLTGTSPVYVEK